MITLIREELAEALKGFRLLKRKKGATKAPLSIRVEPGAHVLRLSSLKLDHTLTYSMPMVEPAPGGEPFHLNAAHLEEAVKGADRKTGIRIDSREKLIRYRTKGVDIEHAFHTVGDEPHIETDLPEGRDIPLPDQVLEAIAEATVCASTDESRYILNGVHIAPGEVAATNGRKLYRRKSGSLPLPEEGITLPHHPVLKLFTCGGNALLRLGPAPKEESLDRRFQLTAGPWTWSTFLVKGKYPNYRQVIPREDQSRTRVEIAEEDAIKLIDILPQLPGMQDHDGPVTVRIEEGRVSVIAGAEGSENRVVLPASKVPDGAGPMVTRFNRTFLREALQLGFRVLAVKDELSAVCMEDREHSRLFLWMPLRSCQPAEVPAPPAKAVPQPAETEPTEPEPASHNRLSPVQAGGQTSERNPSTMAGIQNRNDTRNAPADRPTNGSDGAKTNGAHGTGASNGNGHHGSPEDPVAQAREGLTKLREMLRDLSVVVQEVNASLREAEKDHKALEKEHRSLRKNLRGLQALDV